VGWGCSATSIICCASSGSACACLREPPSCHLNTDRRHRLPARLPSRLPALPACSVRMLGLAFLFMAGLGAMVEERGLRSATQQQQLRAASPAGSSSGGSTGSSSSGSGALCLPCQLIASRQMPCPPIHSQPLTLPCLFCLCCCCSGRGILNNPDLRPQSETTTKFADVKGVDEAKVRMCMK
jgi:hypothetical protein